MGYHPRIEVSDIASFSTEYVLKYARLPGYEHLSQAEYKKLMYEKLEKRRIEIIAKRNKPAVGRKTLLNKTPGTPANLLRRITYLGNLLKIIYVGGS